MRPPEEEFFGPPDEDLHLAEDAAQELEGEPLASSTVSSDSAQAPEEPAAAAVLPISQEESTSPPQTRHSVQQSTLTPSPTLCTLQLQTPKRRRLSCKTTASHAVFPVPENVMCNKLDRAVLEVVETWPSVRFFRGLTGSQQYNWVYERLRGFYVTRVHVLTLVRKARNEYDALPGQERQKQGRQAFKNLGTADRVKVAEAWGRASRPPPHMARYLFSHFVCKDKDQVWHKAKTEGSLLTWMLSKDLVNASRAFWPQESTTLQQLVQDLRKSPEVTQLWKDIELHSQKCLLLAGASDVSVCLEVCPETWAERRELQLHFHAFLKSSGSDLQLRRLGDFAFREARAHVTTSIGGMALTTPNGRTTWCGFFYCCIPQKNGTLFSQATKKPFSGFFVQPTWILNLVQAKKLDSDQAKALLVQCANASRHLKELEVHEAHLEAQAVEKAQEEAQRLLGGTLKESKRFAEVDAFLEQFLTPLHRYRFLVLSGPSRVGKTAFARGLCDPALEILEVNCASGAEPDLRAYRLRKHDLILFDEIVANQVVAQRKVFQAQSAPVQMGCSATNMYSYEIFVWRRKLVLASNNWTSSLTTLSTADKDWVQANSIVLHITQPMWRE